jgi:hypothetical protein
MIPSYTTAGTLYNQRGITATASGGKILILVAMQDATNNMVSKKKNATPNPNASKSCARFPLLLFPSSPIPLKDLGLHNIKISLH